MKYFDWDELKNAELKESRSVCFEDIIAAIDDGRILNDTDHPTPKRYPAQRLLVIEINRYAYIVPYIEDKSKIFLKTIYPSRIMTKKYVIERRK